MQMICASASACSRSAWQTKRRSALFTVNLPLHRPFKVNFTPASFSGYRLKCDPYVATKIALKLRRVFGQEEWVGDPRQMLVS